jgi:hypothetical protein
MVADLFTRHAEGMEKRNLISTSGLDEINTSLRRMERYWNRTDPLYLLG